MKQYHSKLFLLPLCILAIVSSSFVAHAEYSSDPAFCAHVSARTHVVRQSVVDQSLRYAARQESLRQKLFHDIASERRELGVAQSLWDETRVSTQEHLASLSSSEDDRARVRALLAEIDDLILSRRSRIDTAFHVYERDMTAFLDHEDVVVSRSTTRFLASLDDADRVARESCLANTTSVRDIEGTYVKSLEDARNTMLVAIDDMRYDRVEMVRIANTEQMQVATIEEEFRAAWRKALLSLGELIPESRS